MKEEKKEKYESPRTEKTQVNLESGFMTASIFEDVNNQDDGVSIEGHEVGNTGDYTKWDFQDDQINSTNSFN